MLTCYHRWPLVPFDAADLPICRTSRRRFSKWSRSASRRPHVMTTQCPRRATPSAAVVKRRASPCLAHVTGHDRNRKAAVVDDLAVKEARMSTGTIANPALAQELLDALDALSGLHPGFRPAHAKGLMCSGTFTPSREVAKLTRAPHASRASTTVTVRYSNSTGVPTIPDNDPARSGPRGIAIRFHLAEHDHTDIVAHSTNAFPVRTGEEFVEFLRAAAAFGAGQPEALGSFLAAHASAKRFVESPKPIPTSFARESFFAVTSFKFTNADGVSRH